jgi:hypothetical protein
MKLDFIQIGFQKCGTTFLNKSVYAANPDINCIQIADRKQIDKYVLQKLILVDGLEYDKEKVKKELPIPFQGQFDNNLKNGIIYEPFTFLYSRKFDRKNVIDRLHALFPNVKIIFFVRNQETWIISHYSQYIKSYCSK